MSWFKANGAAGETYLRKTITLPTEYWLQFDVYIPSGTLTACSDHDLFGETANLASISTGFFSADAIFLRDTNYPHGAWKWDSFAGAPAVAFVPDVTHTVKVHINGTTVSWFSDGVLLFTYTRTTARDSFTIGSVSAEGCACEAYFFTNVKVGTTNGGSDLFADDFSGGNFASWTTVKGPAVIVSAPSVCRATTLTLTPSRACRGDHVFVSGSGYLPNSAITLVVVDSLSFVVFSEATTDAGGNVGGYFSMPDGFVAGVGSSTNVYVYDADGNLSPVVTLNVCCNLAADGLVSRTPDYVGPPVTIPNTIPLDYVHADGAHWILWEDSSSVYPNTETLPPPPNHALNVTRITDDGLSVTNYQLDTDYAWRFNSSITEFLFCNNWKTSLFFSGWDKPIYDGKLATDGTTVWVAVLTAETTLYPYMTSDDGHCGEPDQVSQFIDLSTLTSGFTVFPMAAGAGGLAYERIYHNSVGALDFYSPDFPNSDGGDNWFGYWNTPRLVVFAGDVGGFSRIGDVASLYYGGETSGVGNDDGFVGGPAFPRYNPGPQGRFLSGLSVAAAAAEPGICHVVWAEGGPWGRCGAGPPDGTLATVWDGDQPNQDYRVSYSRWAPGGNVLDVDLWHTHIDRTNWWFPFEADGANLFRCGFSWPTTADLAVAAAHALKNEHGAPALFLSWPLTRISPSPIGTQVGSDGNPWVDNEPDFMDTAFRYYDLTSGAAVLRQTLDASLLPTVAELDHVYVGAVAPNRLDYGSYGAWGSVIGRGFSISLLYDDPTLAAEPVYAFMLPWRNAEYDANENPVGPAAGFPSLAVYRVAADGSRPFEILDGTRLLGYSICLPGYRGGTPPSGDFFSDAKSLWQPGGLSGLTLHFEQLDRVCFRQWAEPHGVSGTSIPFRATAQHTGLYYDPASDVLYYCVWSADFRSFQIVRTHFCRGCFPCSCAGAAGLHVSKRITWGS